MFASIGERKMRVVRALLLVGWLVLIASLFWDPVSAAWTDPANLASPFRIHDDTATLLGEVLPVAPYQMGNRIFWTMIVPLVPVFLMVFGHEAWRRICPLSFASQLPRYLGLQRRRQTIQRGTGMPESRRLLVGRDSWLQKNAWYVQFGLLFLGLTARLLVINSDRTGLAVALLGVISAAVLVGYLWDGKSWCNYFCPANVVQRIYTEPRGLLESAPHLKRTATPQSMCRTPGKGTEPDKSACVACTLHCGDVDLERAYWDTIEDPARRNVYYMFMGLVLGFYSFYYAYSGTWDYYFSGLWTHEDGALGRLLSPGLFIGGHSIAVPKLVVAPLFLGLFVGATLLLGRAAEAAYRAFRLRRGRIAEGEIINHCLAVSAYLSFNCFYLFGGRPNLLLLPGYATRVVDLLIIAASTMWLWQTLSRTPFRYRRESLAMALLEQLRKLKVDVGRYFEGRTLDELKPDEIYVFGKVLPAFSQEQKLAAYKNLLDDAITTGKVGSAQFLDVLSEMRQEMNVSQADHVRMAEELGIASDTDFDAEKATAQEKAQCVEKYRELLGTALAGHIRQGRTLAAALELPEMQSAVRILRASLQIADPDHASMMQWLSGPEGILATRIEEGLQEMRSLASARFCLEAGTVGEGFWERLETLLVGQLNQRIVGAARGLSAMLAALADRRQAAAYASAMVMLDRDACAEVLREPASGLSGARWRDGMAPEIAALLAGQPALQPVDEIPGLRYRDVVNGAQDVDRCLRVLAQDEEPATTALALTAFAHLQVEVARAFALELLAREGGPGHWMVEEVATHLAGLGEASEAEKPDSEFRVTLRHPEAPERDTSFTASMLTVGSALRNGLVLNDHGIEPYHLSVQQDVDAPRLVRLDASPVYVDGQLCEAHHLVLLGVTRLSFSDLADQGPQLIIEPLSGRVPYRRQRCDAVTRLVWLAGSTLYGTADLGALARAARRAELRRYAAPATVFALGGPAEETLLLRVGEVQELPLDATGQPVAQGPGACWPATPGRARISTLQVVSDFATILAVGPGVVAEPAPDWPAIPQDARPGRNIMEMVS